MQLDFEIDKLTHSLEDAQTGERYQTEVLSLSKDDMKHISKKNGWQFDWNIEIKNPSRSAFKLVISQQPEIIQGLVSTSKEDGYVMMNLIESAPFNFGKNIGSSTYWRASYDNLRARSSEINSKILSKFLISDNYGNY